MRGRLWPPSVDGMLHPREAGISFEMSRKLVHLAGDGILPATAERANEVYAGGQLQGIEIERLQLRLQERGLRGDDGEIVGCTLLVERQGKVQSSLRGVDGSFFIDAGVVVVIECGETVFDLLKGGDDDAALIRGGGVELGARLGDLRAAQAAVEHAEQGVRSRRPERGRGAHAR